MFWAIMRFSFGKTDESVPQTCTATKCTPSLRDLWDWQQSREAAAAKAAEFAA